MDYSELNVNGDAPSLDGLVCQGFLCAAYVFEGVLQETAYTTYLKFDEQWYRLYFDFDIIFWRVYDETPKAWEVESIVFPVKDVGRELGVVGQKLLSYKMKQDESGNEVHFYFEYGKQFVIRSKDDVSDFEIVN